MRSNILIILVIILAAITPAYAQLNSFNQEKETFIEQGKILTGLSFSLITGSEDELNEEYIREGGRISLNLKGIYFLTGHLGVGPTLSYVFSYGDLNSFTPDKKDTEIRNSFWAAGLRVAYFVPLKQILRRYDNTYLFFKADAVLRHHLAEPVGTQTIISPNEFGYRLAIGLLIPTGGKVAINTTVGLRVHRHKYEVDSQNNIKAEVKWPKAISFSLGINYNF